MVTFALLVLAMIASYAGAFAKPTLHHLEGRGRRPPQQMRRRASTTGTELGITRGRRRRRRPRRGARTQDRRRASSSNRRAASTSMSRAAAGAASPPPPRPSDARSATEAACAPAVDRYRARRRPGDPSGHRSSSTPIIFVSIGRLRRCRGVRPFWSARCGGRWTLALRTVTLSAYSALLAGVVTVYVDAALGALTGTSLAGVRRIVALRDGRRRRGHRRGRRVRHRRSDGRDRVPGDRRQRRRRRAGRPAAAVGFLHDVQPRSCRRVSGSRCYAASSTSAATAP